ncbi:MAG: iron complex outerrane recepter protein [Sphingomonadales bacterium]|jgi:iron complex outermembrane receptor protein|nr:iron complex outerrane recepter protein [Sphingomonadales bacterium]
MNGLLKTTVSTLVLATASFAPACAWAQEAAAPTAQEEDGASGNEIVVTAQKRAQNLQDVSLSIAAIGGTDLVNSQINDITDFGGKIPNVNVTTQLGRAVITIRGMGQAAPLNGKDPSVALHLDGAVISQSSAQLGAFFDLQRIEVLRGPQGTLYGRNSTGGVVNLISNKPTRDPSGYVRGTYGNFGEIGIEGAVSGPVAGDKLLARVAFRSENRGGTGVNELSGADINNVNTRAVRGQIQAKPSHALSILVSAEYYREADANYVSTYYGPGYPGTTVPGLIQRGANFSPNPRNIRSEAEQLNDRRTWAVTGIVDWDINENVSLHSITNHRDLMSHQIYDFDTSPVVAATVNDNYQKSKQTSEELQFNYKNGPIQAMVTGYYFKEDYIGDSLIGINPNRYAPPGLQSVAIVFNGLIKIKSWAVFGNTSYRFSDWLTLNVGGRYTTETRNGVTNTISGATTSVYATGATSTDFSPNVTLELRPVRGVMAYATYSEGFKSGVIPIGSPNPITRPERVKNYEAGVKTTLFDRVLMFNASAFYEKYTDLQVSRGQVSLTNPTAVSLLIENAAGAITKGFEAEFVLQPTRQFSINGSVGYVDAYYTDYKTVNSLDQPRVVLHDLSGFPLPNAPKWTLNGEAHYNARLRNGAELSFNAGLSYKSLQWFTAFKEPRLSQSGYTLANANIRYTSPDQKFFANVWAKNLTNKFYRQVVFLNSTTRELLNAIGEPRTYGVTVGYNF